MGNVKSSDASSLGSPLCDLYDHKYGNVCCFSIIQEGYREALMEKFQYLSEVLYKELPGFFFFCGGEMMEPEWLLLY